MCGLLRARLLPCGTRRPGTAVRLLRKLNFCTAPSFFPGLIPSFCDACEALTATCKHHPAHLSPATTNPQEQHHNALQLLHRIAAALFELFYLLSATWPRNSQIQIKTTHTGLLNPTLRPIVRPAVWLCVAMLSAVCAAPCTPAPSEAFTCTPAATSASDTSTPSAATAPPAPAGAKAAAAAAATQAPVLRAALLFGFTLANTLHELFDKTSPTDRDMAAFMKTVLIGINGNDDMFQLFLIVLTVLASKRYLATGGVSVWGDGTAVEPHHLQLLQYLGMAPLPEALLTSPDAVPHPYTDDNNNAGEKYWLRMHMFCSGSKPLQAHCPLSAVQLCHSLSQAYMYGACKH